MLSRIFIAGFSQGACVATEFVARHPSRYGGLLAGSYMRVLRFFRLARQNVRGRSPIHFRRHLCGKYLNVADRP